MDANGIDGPSGRLNLMALEPDEHLRAGASTFLRHKKQSPRERALFLSAGTRDQCDTASAFLPRAALRNLL